MIGVEGPGAFEIAGVSEFGTGVARVTVTEDSPQARIHLALERGAEIHGTVRDRSGNVATGVPLLFLHVDHLQSFDPTQRVLSASNWPYPDSIEAGGLWRRAVRSNSEGEFVVTNLRRGEYRVFPGRGNAFEPGVEALVPGLRTGARNVQLVVHRPHLVVRLSDEKGERLTPSRPAGGLRAKLGDLRWPQGPRPYVVAEDGKRVRG
ncbi:MAG: hypothetical protein AAF368_18810, partial [Planctomycetota bacterium]